MSGVRKLFRYMQGRYLQYTISMGAAFLSNLFALIIPLLIRFAIDHIIGDIPVPAESLIQRLSGGSLAGVGLLFIGVTFLRAFFLFLKSFTAAAAAESVAKKMKDTVMSHVQNVQYAFFAKYETGDVIQRATSDVETVRRFLAVQFVEIASILFMVSIITYLMLTLSVPMTVVALLLIPLITVSSALFFLRIKSRFLEADEAEAETTSYLQEYLSGVTIVKAFGREAYEQERFRRLNEDLSRKVYQLIMNFAAFWSLSDLFCFIQIGLVLYFGTVWAVTGQITLGTVVAFITYENMILYPIRQLGRVLSEFGKSVVAIGRIDEILATEADQQDDGTLEPEILGEVEFQDVWFSYPDQPDQAPVLKGLSFHIAAGETVGILGPTGSGKSTLVYLLTRLYEPDRGTILIDGVDIRQIRKRHLRNQVGLVLQEAFLYSKSIGENIAIKGMPQQGKIVRAARIASIHQHIEHFDEAYNTQVGERGVTLSGGQRQRVAIARTIFEPMPVMIFDDSLSAVDTDTDRRIRMNLMENRSGSTVLLISHRITTLMEADRIMVMENGVVTEMATHDDLMNREGLYRRVWTIQNQYTQRGSERGDPLDG
jgi:ATP-binding cassette, subfamily B, bacterial